MKTEQPVGITGRAQRFRQRDQMTEAIDEEQAPDQALRRDLDVQGRMEEIARHANGSDQARGKRSIHRDDVDHNHMGDGGNHVMTATKAIVLLLHWLRLLA